MTDHDDEIDWSKTTFEGSRREQLRRWCALSLRQRMEALDRMSDLAGRPFHKPLPTSPQGQKSPAVPGVQEPRVSYAADGVNEIALRGCTPTPLASYLKALAVLRLVAEQAGDPDATGCWRGDVFVLRTRLSRDGLLQFFLKDYQPTPLVAPWNGGSGFYYQEGKLKEKDPVTGKKLKTGKRDQPTEATRTLEAIEKSTASRLTQCRTVITSARSAVQQYGFVKAPEGEEKDRFIAYVRNIVPEGTLRWLDAAMVLADGKPNYPPLLGTGGNDGNLDFTNNFMQRLGEVFDVSTGDPKPEAQALLNAALTGAPAAALLDRAIGQFSPGSAGGPNAASGFEGSARINPWDFILMLEGALLLAASAARRLESGSAAILSAPFTVRSRLGTEGAAALTDDGDSRGEIWMPIWHVHFTLEEVLALFGEGRAALGTRPVRDGLDFARAVARLGVDRGISAFQRFGFLMRAGKAFLAAPLSRISVRRNPQADLIDELERRDWLARIQRLAREDKAPSAFRAAAAQLDAMLFALTQRSERVAVEKVLRQLGRIEAACSNSPRIREVLVPVPALSYEWVRRANDGSAEFQIALALAGLSLSNEQSGKRSFLGVRAHLAPVTSDGSKWDENSNTVCWGAGALERNLAAVMHRRRLEATRMNAEGELSHSRTGARMKEVSRFLDGQTDDRRITELLWGLACVKLDGFMGPKRQEESDPLPAYALLKPFFTSESVLRNLGWLPPDRSLRLPAQIPARLAADDVASALHLAWHRLRALGVKLPGRTPPLVAGIRGPRLLAALMIPLTFAETGRLLRWLDLAPETDQPEAVLDEST